MKAVLANSSIPKHGASFWKKERYPLIDSAECGWGFFKARKVFLKARKERQVGFQENKWI